jgi:hypothetical protein
LPGAPTFVVTIQHHAKARRIDAETQQMFQTFDGDIVLAGEAEIAGAIKRINAGHG